MLRTFKSLFSVVTPLSGIAALGSFVFAFAAESFPFLFYAWVMLSIFVVSVVGLLIVMALDKRKNIT